jgi:hypothetical protein
VKILCERRIRKEIKGILLEISEIGYFYAKGKVDLPVEFVILPFSFPFF